MSSFLWVRFYYLLVSFVFSLSLKMSGEMLRVKKLSEFAVLPSRGSKYAAGKLQVKRLSCMHRNCIIPT